MASVAPLASDTNQFERVDVVLTQPEDECVVATAEQVYLCLIVSNIYRDLK